MRVLSLIPWKRLAVTSIGAVALCAAALAGTATAAQADPPPNGRIISNHNQVLL